MAQRRFHYDQAFEQYLRRRAIPYVAVDEAKRALGPPPPPEIVTERHSAADVSGKYGPRPLKSFDFVVYSRSGPNLLVDVKGRKHTGRSNRSLDNWVTEADVRSLGVWEDIFGGGFGAAFAFLYWCQQEPPGALFHEVFESGHRWYAVLAVRLGDYRSHMRTRSPRWGTVSMPARDFAQRAVPLKELL